MTSNRTLQAEALSLVAAKTRASLMVEGELPEEGLAALDGDGGDMFLALARKLADPNGELPDERSLEALFAAARAATHDEDQLLGGDWVDADQARYLNSAETRRKETEVLPLLAPFTQSERSLGRVVRFDKLAEAIRHQKRHRTRRAVPEQLEFFAA